MIKRINSIIWFICGLLWVFNACIHQIYVKNTGFAVFFGVIALLNFFMSYKRWPKKVKNAPNNSLSR